MVLVALGAGIGVKADFWPPLLFVSFALYGAGALAPLHQKGVGAILGWVIGPLALFLFNNSAASFVWDWRYVIVSGATLLALPIGAMTRRTFPTVAMTFLIAVACVVVATWCVCLVRAVGYSQHPEYQEYNDYDSSPGDADKVFRID